jgi:hypothetical protein
MTLRQSALLLLTGAIVAMLAACGSDSHPIVVAFSSPPASLSAGSLETTLTVTVTHDSKNAGVTWSVTCANTNQCGTLVASTLTATYTAPVAIPSGGVMITAKSNTDPTKSATATITITPASTLPDGNYAFQLSGQDTNGPFNVAGVFTVASGAITVGEQDFVDFKHSNFNGITTGTIKAGAMDSNLQIVLTTTDTNVGVGGTGVETFSLTQTDPVDGILTWFDGFAAGSGTLIAQNATARGIAPASGYAFVSSGFDSIGCALAVGGVINVDGVGTISGSGSVLDANDCGSPNQAQTIANTSTVTGPDTFGRVIFTLVPSGTAQVAFAGYIVDSSGRIFFVETADTLAGITGGIAYSQGANTGTFSGATLSGVSYVVAGQGEDANGLLNLVGSLTFNSDGSVTGSANFNDIASQYLGTGNLAAPAGSFTVDSTGRVTLAGVVLTDMVNGNPPLTFNLQFYLDGSGNAPAASMDVTDNTAGPAYQQTSGASANGAFASGALGVSGTTGRAWSAVGPITYNSTNGAVAGFTDFNYFGTTSANTTLSGTVVNGNGPITGLGADTPANSDTFYFYVIDNNRGFGIETDNVQLGLIYLQFQN